jgi:SAM-dependent methyltransferase
MNSAFDEDLDGKLLALYLQKSMASHLAGGHLTLAAPADVFSSFQVDRGTRLLLQEITASGRRWDRVLDVGCGYGPLALHLAAGGAAQRAEGFDPDALAVAFARHNARANHLAGAVGARGGIAYPGFPTPDVECWGAVPQHETAGSARVPETPPPAPSSDSPLSASSLSAADGYAVTSPSGPLSASPCPRVSASSGFDAVVCNLPAKAGDDVHKLILLGAFHQLRPGGQVWMVVVEPLAKRIDEILAIDAVAPPVKFPHQGHVVYNYSFTAPPPLPQQPYVRAGSQPFEWRKHSYGLTAFQGLAEFDTRNWATDMALDVFADALGRGPVPSLVVCEPGQGHLPLLAWRIAGRVGEMTVLSRDLLALAATRQNLLDNGFDGMLRFAHHPAWLCPAEAARPDAALVRLNEKEGLDVNVAKLRRLRDTCGPCPIIVGCPAAFGGRLQGVLKKAGLRISIHKQKKGTCAFCIQSGASPQAS